MRRSIMGWSHRGKEKEAGRISFGVPAEMVICFVVVIFIITLGTVSVVKGQVEVDPDQILCEQNKSNISVDYLLRIYGDINNPKPGLGGYYFVDNILNFGAVSICLTNITKVFVGETVDESSIFTTFTQGYHTLGIPSVDYWGETRDFFRNIRPPLVNIREVQRDTDRLRAYVTNCHKSVNEAIDNFKTPELKKCVRLLKELRECDNFYKTVVETDMFHYLITDTGDRDLDWYWRLLRACSDSIIITMEAFYRAVTPLPYNGRRHTWDYSPFRLMLMDAMEYEMGVFDYVENIFPTYIGKVTADGKQDLANTLQLKLDEIKKRLLDPSLPYHKIYYNGNWNQMKSDWAGVGKLKGGLLHFIKDVLLIYTTKFPGTGLSFPEYVARWRSDVNNFVDDYDQVAVRYINALKIVYDAYLQVEPSSEPEYDSSNTLVRDGKWKWEPDSYALHSMRLAWDLMGAVLEELKCYTKQEYFFDLRQKAIRDTQLDLTGSGALFSGISYTMLQPCRINNNNESDLVTQYCTAENHEICAPMAPFNSQQRPESLHHGGLGLLKPRWIYRYDETNVKCVGRKDYFTLMYVCRCGFRLDCGDDLGENITCQLQENDRLRGQCRGGVAYPCKTLPLAPGMHNETCKSGYCHMRRNSCEDRPFIYHESSVAVSVWRVIYSWDRCLIHFVGLLVALQNGGLLWQIFKLQIQPDIL